jgi:hypothetical protein
MTSQKRLALRLLLRRGVQPRTTQEGDREAADKTSSRFDRGNVLMQYKPNMTGEDLARLLERRRQRLLQRKS